MNKDYKELLTKACNLLAVATDSFPSDDEIVIAIDELMEEIKEVESKDDDKDNWINVKDRLPDGNELCLICVEGEGICIAYYQPIGDKFSNHEPFWQSSSCRFSFVTHWQPLPEPPKEDKNGTF